MDAEAGFSVGVTMSPPNRGASLSVFGAVCTALRLMLPFELLRSYILTFGSLARSWTMFV